MNKLHHTLLGICAASLLAVGVYGVAAIAAMPTVLSARLAGGSEVPAVVTSATGIVEATLAPDSNILTWKVTYSGLSGPATGAHFHGSAMAGQNAGVVVPMAGSLVSPITGSATLTTSQAADLSAGKWYVNVHTVANPDGEIRGQLNANITISIRR